MASLHKVSSVILFTLSLLVNCGSGAVHSHSEDLSEREVDGAYRPRDSDHYDDAGHNSEFDHEAILGSVKEAEEFDKLHPEESKRRLAKLLPLMDLNGDQFIDRLELKKWILQSFVKLSREEATDRLVESDDNHDGAVSWSEYLMAAFDVENEEDIGAEDTGDTGMLVREEKAMWNAADVDGDGKLDINEFEVFVNPEEHESMHHFLLNQTMREKDKNGDGLIDFSEYVGDRGSQQDRSWLVSERDKFEAELDLDRNGHLDADEIHRWIVPDNDEIAEEEVDHLFAAADDDHDDRLSYDEIILHYDQFVGSEADVGNDLDGHYGEL